MDADAQCRTADVGVAGGRAARENGIEVCSSSSCRRRRRGIRLPDGGAGPQEGGDLGNDSLTLTIHERGDGGSISAFFLAKARSLLPSGAASGLWPVDLSPDGLGRWARS